MKTMETKICSKCKRDLPLTEFYKKKCAKDGLQYVCKECQKKESKKGTRTTGVNTSLERVERVDVGGRILTKVYTNADLSKFTPRELMAELKARGFQWDYMLEPQRKIYYEKI